MIVRIATYPELFGKHVICNAESKLGAIAFLDAALENVIVITDLPDFTARLIAEVASLPPKYGQRIAILVAELGKRKKHIVKSVSLIPKPAGLVDRLDGLFRSDFIDAVVCASEADKLSLETKSGRPVILLPDYQLSTEEGLRRSYMSSQSLHSIPKAEAQLLLARALPDSKKIVIADKMFGVVAKDRFGTQLENFAKGLVFAAKCGASNSRPREVHLITVGGQTGGKGGYIDPVVAEANIRAAITASDTGRVISSLAIDFKQDGNPPVFRDRLLACGGRCWGIRHGIDDLGRLELGASKKSPTYIDPDGIANRQLLALIAALPAAV